MISITATMTTGTAELHDNTLKEMVKWMDGQHVEFERAAVKVHRKTIFEILIQLLRFTPVLTGRLRGSWTPYMDRYNKQSAYMRFLNDASLVRSKPKTVSGKLRAAVQGILGMDQVSKGKREGFFREAPFITTIGSNVVYASAANKKSRFLDLTIADAARIINANFEQFLAATKKAGWIPSDYKDDPRPS